MKTQNLKNSIENLYKVFAKYPLKSTINGCPCCVGEDQESILHSKPLNKLSGEDLSFYGFKAMTTFGEVDDFKHFLPRLFEIAVEGDFEYDTAILFKKLNYADWQGWEESERTAIDNFFLKLFHYVIDSEPEKIYQIEDFLTAIACAVKDLTPYLNFWLEEISANKIATLKFFVVDWDYGMSDAFLADKPEIRLQIKNWLTSEKTVSILENLFLADFQKSNDLSEILETIYSLTKK